MGGPASAEVKKLDAAASASAEEVGQKLYAKRIKIYPKKITGQFQTWRWALVWLTQILYYGLPWVNWHDRQAVLFHLAERKFYIFGIVLWPQDFIYLTGLLVISALALFLFTAVAGRLWCGYACPQTVYTEIFVWIEQLIEGDRPKQMKFDQGPMSARKLALKALKFGAWGLFALWTGFTFVGYFTPIRELWFEVLTLAVAGWSLFWMLFYAGFTVLQAGFMREQVCKYMCPYARFQSAMFDKDTLIVTYDTKRGEPRGARSKKVDFKAQGMGACVDCGVCVQVCPTGIDIRHGLQYECIGCGACVAACPNASAMLFTSAKVSHLALLPQGQVERQKRVISMVARMDSEGFGQCSNVKACEAECPKEISVENIARMNREYLSAVFASDKEMA